MQFNGLHPELNGGFDLGVGGGGRGYVGTTYDVFVTTDASGKFVISPPALPEGFQRAQIVAVGQPDQPPLPGLSSALTRAFRIDKTPPEVLSASLTPGGPTLPQPPNTNNLATLQTLSLNVTDPVNQAYPNVFPGTTNTSPVDPQPGALPGD